MERKAFIPVIMLLLAATSAQADQYGLKEGTPQLESVGPLAFGPPGILLVADTKQAAIFAIDTGDTSGDPSGASVNLESINETIAGMLGVTPRDLSIHDLAVNPASGNIYLSVSRGRGPDATPVLLKVGTDGKIDEVSLKKVTFAKAKLPNAPEDRETGQGRRRRNNRTQSITDMAYVDGRVFIAGLSNEEFASKLRTISFPFEAADSGTSVEIFHGAHGQFETRSPVRTFVTYDIQGDSHLLAAYTCTPLVKFRVSDLKPGMKLKGTTIAELGNRNNPLDMIVYNKDGQDYLLIANTSRGIMKVTTDKISSIEGITEPIRGGGTAGLSYETIADWKGVVQLDKLNDNHAVLLVMDESGSANLKTMALP